MTDGFKFADLIKPGEGAKQAFRRELETRRDAWTRPGYFYRGGADLLLQHGQHYTGRSVPARYEHLRGEEGECFFTSRRAAEADPSLTYVEGYYNLRGQGHFTPHAWCIDSDGEIVDLVANESWIGLHAQGGGVIQPMERWAYWGVPFHIELVVEHDDSGRGLGMLDRPAADVEMAMRLGQDATAWSNAHEWPILKVPYDPDRRTLGL